MKPFRKPLAVLLCAALCVCAACAMAGGADEDDWDARYEQLMRFATEKYAAWWYDDYEEEPEPSGAYLDAERYKGINPGASHDYSNVETLVLDNFTQAQFDDILTRVPNLRTLTLYDCTVEDYSPLLQIAPQLILSLYWEPGLPERLAMLPNLQGLELNGIADADLSPLTALTELEHLVLWLNSDSTVDLHPLGSLPELRSLTLYCRGTPADTLPDMPALQELNLSCAIDLAQLTHTPALERLHIGYAMSGDLTLLYTLPALSYLEINAHDIDVTDYVDQLEALHEAMPGLEIVFYYCC